MDCHHGICLPVGVGGDGIGGTMSIDKPKAPSSHVFHVTSPFQFVLDARNAGYSRADIRWILDTLEWTEPLRRALEADAAKRGRV